MNDEALASRRALQTSAREAFQEFLSARTWDYFATVTFATPQRYALTAVSKVARSLSLDVPKGESLFSRAFVAGEPHKLGNWHVHGLLKSYIAPDDFGEAVPLYIERQVKRFGWSRVEAIKSNNEVACYISKYLLKDDRSEYQVYGYDW